jgi:hypothetical protein
VVKYIIDRIEGQIRHMYERDGGAFDDSQGVSLCNCIDGLLFINVGFIWRNRLSKKKK